MKVSVPIHQKSYRDIYQEHNPTSTTNMKTYENVEIVEQKFTYS